MSNIHQEILLKATPARVYQALVDGKTFAETTGAPATGEAAEGSPFTAFGGHITGRNVELSNHKLVVQAWRAKTWPVGVYSIVRFELHPDGAGTKLVLDHDGFPADMKEHLSKGWHSNYWEHFAKLA